MPRITGVKHSAKIAFSESKEEDLHDDSIYIVRTGHQTKFYDSFNEIMEILPRIQVI